MQQITLKKSTIAAMNQAFQSYCNAIDQQKRIGLDVKGVPKDLNGYLLMLFVRQIITQSGVDMTAGKALYEQARMQIAFQQLDDD